MNADIAQLWDRVRDRAGPYPPMAFAFVQQGLRHTTETIHAQREERAAAMASELHAELGPDGERHVSGQELCFGLRDFAVKQFGLLARTVLASWNIQSTEDFGKIVFALVESQMLRKSDSDSMLDFEAVYDFDDAFAGESRSLR